MRLLGCCLIVLAACGSDDREGVRQEVEVGDELEIEVADETEVGDEVEEIEVATTDPLNLVGIITGGPRVPAVRGHVLRYRDGAPVEVSRPLAV